MAALSALLPVADAAEQSPNRPLPEASQSTVGYDSVADALDALRATPGVAFKTENGWLIAIDEATYSVWSFAPEDYPAYPAAVKRQAIPHGNESIVQMSVLCEATKEACDALARTFAEMNGLPLEQ